jgi:hypothetical protein
MAEAIKLRGTQGKLTVRHVASQYAYCRGEKESSLLAGEARQHFSP